MIKKYTQISILLASLLLCSSAMAYSTKAESDLSGEVSLVNYDLGRKYENEGSRGAACEKSLTALKAKYNESVPHVKYLTCDPGDEGKAQIR